MSYLSDRLAAYHITDKENTFKAENDEGRVISTWRFFTETDKGDIQINYLCPNGTVAWYNHGNVQTRDFAASATPIRRSTEATNTSRRKAPK